MKLLIVLSAIFVMLPKNAIALSNTSTFTDIPAVNSPVPQLPTPEGYSMINIGQDFNGQDTIITGRVVGNAQGLQLTGYVSTFFSTFQEAIAHVSHTVNYTALSLPDGTRLKMVPNVLLNLHFTSSSLLTGVNGPVDLAQLSGKKVMIKIRVNAANFTSATSATVDVVSLRVVPIALGGCTYESDVFRTVPEGCQTLDGKVYFTGANDAIGTYWDSRLNYTGMYLYPRTQGGGVAVNTPSFPLYNSAAPLCTGGSGTISCGGVTAATQISTLRKQLNAGFDVPLKSDWINYSNSRAGRLDHLFAIEPVFVSQSFYSKPSIPNSHLSDFFIWLQDESSRVLHQTSGGNTLLVKSAPDPSLIAADSWRVLFGEYAGGISSTISPGLKIPNDVYRFPTKQGVSLSLFSSKSVQDVEVKNYFYFNTSYASGMDPNPTRRLGLVARYQGPSIAGQSADQNYYFGEVALVGGVFQANIWKNVNGTLSRLATGAMPNPLQSYGFSNGSGISSFPISGGLLTFRVAGNTLTLKFTEQTNFTETVLLTATDTAFTQPGLTGVRHYQDVDTFPSQFPGYGYATISGPFWVRNLSVAVYDLDIDGNGSVDPYTDGNLILAYLFGQRGSQLSPFIAANATRSLDAIGERLGTLVANGTLDIDGNGKADAFTDGNLILAYLFGLRSDSNLSAYVSAGATRNLDQIRALLKQLTGI